MRVRLLMYALIVAVISATLYYLPTEIDLGSDYNNSNGLTKADVVEVYNTLQKYTGVPGAIPPLVILDSEVINAWVSPDSLTVTTGMLNFVKNKDELAAVVGHEMGHVMLQHFQLDGDSRLHEANADKYGIFLMLRAGYNVCNAEGVWQRFDDRFGDDILTSSHPSPAQRSWELHFPMCQEAY